MPRGDQSFGVEFKTCFNVPADGNYTFTIDSNGGAMLFVHDIRVIDEPKTPKSGTFSGSVRLQAGWHPLRILYRRISSAPSIKFSVADGQNHVLVLDEFNLHQSAPAK